MTKRVALYLRVSTGGQTTENQRAALMKVADQAGWNIVAEFEDAGISGAKGRDKRPGFDKLLKASTRREFDLVAAWSVDRLGRSLADLVGFLNQLRDVGVDLYLHQQSLDTSTDAGRALFQMMGVFAEWERGMIRERVKAGLARVVAEGRVLGRKRISADREAEVVKLLASGVGIDRTAKQAGVGVSTVMRIRTALGLGKPPPD